MWVRGAVPIVFFPLIALGWNIDKKAKDAYLTQSMNTYHAALQHLDER
jgi:hypothetical protein